MLPQNTLSVRFAEAVSPQISLFICCKKPKGFLLRCAFGKRIATPIFYKSYLKRGKTMKKLFSAVLVLAMLCPVFACFATVGAIAIVLAGAFPLVYVITKLLQKPLMKLGKLLGVNDVAAGGLIATLANSIATFERVKDMDDRGKVVNIAFAVSAAFVFGDHMGFTAGFAPELLPAMIVGKLVGGVTAVAVALLLTRKK